MSNDRLRERCVATVRERLLKKGGSKCKCPMCEAGRLLPKYPEALDKAMRVVSMKEVLLTARSMCYGMEPDSYAVVISYTYAVASFICGWAAGQEKSDD